MAQFESIPLPADLKKNLPANSLQTEFVRKSRETIKAILENRDPRFLLVIGPCSIHDITAAKEYATKLKHLSDQVSNTFYIVMRTYFEKPRTNTGWKGLLYDPQLDGSHDILSGLSLSRQLLLDLAKIGVPAATEFLDPITPHFYGDLISWGAVGARTTSSQIHRQMVSGLKMPVGFKNTTEGDLSIVVNALASAAEPHTFIGMGEEGQAGIVRTKGNQDVHMVLRGSEKEPNYNPESIELALALLRKVRLPSRVLVDCSHDNSFKKHENQPRVFQSVINQILEGNTDIRGLMVESHLHEGKQRLCHDLSQLKYGISLTDGCMGWEMTEKLILWADQNIRSIEPEITSTCLPHVL